MKEKEVELTVFGLRAAAELLECLVKQGCVKARDRILCRILATEAGIDPKTTTLIKRGDLDNITNGVREILLRLKNEEPDPL
jgi:hypothetical protein